MKNLITILTLFSMINSFAQDLEKIKKSDTIYIYFKEDKINQIHHIENGKTKTYDNYFFDYSNKQVSFQFWNLQTFNSQKKIKRKNFLKKTLILS